MDSLYINANQEYCARYGVRLSKGSVALALQLAESKYKKIVGRDLHVAEIKALQLLIDEVLSWRTAKAS